jgi:iron complex transport system ATP-binding protein
VHERPSGYHYNGSDVVVGLESVGVWFADGTVAISGVDWTVRKGENWALLGPNGAGKSTLLGVLCASRLPSTGTAEVLGAKLGRVDMRALREAIGVVDVRLRVPAHFSVLDYVLTGSTQTVVLRPDSSHGKTGGRAQELLELVGLGAIATRRIGVCSQGERAKARLARSLMPDPSLLVLDEPAAGLDLPGRADLLEALTAIALAEPNRTAVYAVHHLEELPPTTTHVALVSGGRLLSHGPARDCLSDEHLLSRCFGRPVSAFTVDGRWYAAASPRHAPSSP